MPLRTPNNAELLLVDDEPAVIQLEKKMIEELGYHVVERTSSTDALNTFAANPSAFDLVISDMAMPSMTGDQLAKKIIEIRPDMPIVICTGFSDRIHNNKPEELGIKGLLMKPILKKKMAQMIRNVLDAANGSS